MGHITQCPHCSTLFRVVADQLKLSQGWVRCGQCGQEFDAQAALVDMGALAATSRATPTVPLAADAPAPDADALPLAVDILLEDEGSPDSPAQAAPAPAIDPDGVQPGGVDLLLPTEDGVSPGPPAQPAAVTRPEEDLLPHEAEDTRDAPLPDADSHAPTPSVAMDAERVPDVSFVRQARRRAFWQQPSVRAALALAAVLLTVALTAQVLVQQRDRLAAAHPEWRPWLTALCEPLGCQVGAWRAIESVVIDSSALVRLRDNDYRFEVSLRNTSDLLLTVPALELSLTNHRDEVVIRRVILADEWSDPITQLPPQSAQTLTVQMALTTPEDLRMSGYRALVFYP